MDGRQPQPSGWGAKFRGWISQLNSFGWTYENWKTFFFVAALWNLLAAIPAIIRPDLYFKIYYGLATDDPYTIMLNRSFWIAVAIFGMGYWMVSRNPEKQTGIIVMGIVGKFAVAISWYYMVFTGMAEFMPFFGATGDSIFTVYFVIYLLSGPRSSETVV